jgi:transcriptional regulator with XRE-family HTH domain
MGTGVGERLRALREEYGWSQAEVARRVVELRDTSDRSWAQSLTRWHQTTVGKIENGSRTVRWFELEALAEVLAVPPDDLRADWTADEDDATSRLAAPPPSTASGQLAALRRARAEMAAVAFRARRALAQIDADIAALGGTDTDDEDW